MKLKITLFFLFLLGIAGINAQNSVVTAGGDALGSGGSISQTIGQIAYTTNQSNDGSVAQGVQQAFEISVVSVTNTELNLNITAYPNPTTKYLNLNVMDSNFNNLSYAIYDLQGRIIKNEKITTTNTLIDMQGLAIATYFIKVKQNQQVQKTFKIIKK